MADEPITYVVVERDEDESDGAWAYHSLWTPESGKADDALDSAEDLVLHDRKVTLRAVNIDGGKPKDRRVRIVRSSRKD